MELNQFDAYLFEPLLLGFCYIETKKMCLYKRILAEKENQSFA